MIMPVFFVAAALREAVPESPRTRQIKLLLSMFVESLYLLNLPPVLFRHNLSRIAFSQKGGTVQAGFGQEHMLAFLQSGDADGELGKEHAVYAHRRGMPGINGDLFGLTVIYAR